MNNISIGKLRGLQQIATPNGLFIICALDHRGSMKTLLKQEAGIDATYTDLVDYKMELCQIITPFASGILLDPAYGAAQGIARGVLPGNTGLLVSIEATGYETKGKGRLSSILKDWSVEKIKRMGASAVKMLIYYRPDLGSVSKKQLQTVLNTAKDCIKHDIAFLVEPLSYPTETRGSAEYFASRKTDIVIETARQMTALPIDVLKAEFPADMNFEKDKGKLIDSCQRLNDASSVPWVLLSAGVGYDLFRSQVEIACQAGASGFLGGRGIWQDALKYRDRQERIKYLKTVVVERLKELAEITHKYAKPWHQKADKRPNNLLDIKEHWYINY
jgi:tagatose 1,6-diphosphate aldolase